MLKAIHEVLEEVNAKTTNADKLEVLRENDSKTLRFVLQAAYDDKVQTLLPDGEPPYDPVESGKQVTLNELYDDIPKLYKYGPMHNAPGHKVEFLFMKMLANLQKKEAMVLVKMKDKNLQSLYKRITKPLVKEYLKDYVTIK